ncbi:hypothetical protein AAF712_009029 [Marasmius tenuissimus]|uniref:Uncharacterized protein n=1 Tax=Marasmius tenuissimus TaxID=585030 RepID=A0ABR2ZRR8_9AGAR|nr:hypothetical protein PM082_002200 [Marasmius tenuissimus]
MQLSLSILSLSLFSLGAFGAPQLEARQITNQHGTISAPSSGSLVSSGSQFDFHYIQSDWCHDGYSPFTVWLTNYAPSTANVNSTGGFSEGDYTHFFGQFLAANFGLPPMSPVPPASLTLPAMKDIAQGAQLYVSVIETARDCPPGGVPPQYALTTVPVTFGSA